MVRGRVSVRVRLRLRVRVRLRQRAVMTQAGSALGPGSYWWLG